MSWFFKGFLIGEAISGPKRAAVRQISVTLQYARNKYNFGEFQAALIAYEQALALAQTHNETDFQITILLEMGDSYRQIKQYDKALNVYNLGLNIAKKNDDKAWLLNKIGITYHNANQFEQALNYYNKAKAIKLGRKHRNFRRWFFRNAGVIYRDLGDYQQARTDFNEALKLNKNDDEFRQEIKDFIERLPK